MRKLIASVLIVALLCGAVVTPAQAGSPVGNAAQVTEGNRRPNRAPSPRPQPQPQPNRRPQQNGHRPQQPQHRPSQPQHRPQSHRNSNSDVAVGLLIGAVIGSMITHAAHR